MARVGSKQLRVVDAAVLLRLSYRQAKRLWKRYREAGAAGLKHRSAGRRSNRAYAERFRHKVLGPGAEEVQWSGGGALRPDAGRSIWIRRTGCEWRRRRHRRRPERKQHFGELVLMDGSFHAWLEER